MCIPYKNPVLRPNWATEGEYPFSAPDRKGPLPCDVDGPATVRAPRLMPCDELMRRVCPEPQQRSMPGTRVAGSVLSDLGMLQITAAHELLPQSRRGAPCNTVTTPRSSRILDGPSCHGTFTRRPPDSAKSWRSSWLIHRGNYLMVDSHGRYPRQRGWLRQ